MAAAEPLVLVGPVTRGVATAVRPNQGNSSSLQAAVVEPHALEGPVMRVLVTARPADQSCSQGEDLAKRRAQWATRREIRQQWCPGKGEGRASKESWKASSGCASKIPATTLNDLPPPTHKEAEQILARRATKDVPKAESRSFSTAKQRLGVASRKRGGTQIRTGVIYGKSA